MLGCDVFAQALLSTMVFCGRNCLHFPVWAQIRTCFAFAGATLHTHSAGACQGVLDMRQRRV